jgi:hypothetical protein
MQQLQKIRTISKMSQIAFVLKRVSVHGVQKDTQEMDIQIRKIRLFSHVRSVVTRMKNIPTEQKTLNSVHKSVLVSIKLNLEQLS